MLRKKIHPFHDALDSPKSPLVLMESAHWPSAWCLVVFSDYPEFPSNSLYNAF